MEWPTCAIELQVSIGHYHDVWIAAIASSRKSLATQTAAICVRFQGRRIRHVYVTMQITFLARKSALIYRRGLRQRVASLTIDCNGVFAIRAYYCVSHSLSQYHSFTKSSRPQAFASRLWFLCGITSMSASVDVGRHVIVYIGTRKWLPWCQVWGLEAFNWPGVINRRWSENKCVVIHLSVAAEWQTGLVNTH